MFVTPVHTITSNPDLCNCGDVINLSLPRSFEDTTVDDTVEEYFDNTTEEDLNNLFDIVLMDVNTIDTVLISSPSLPLFSNHITHLVPSFLLTVASISSPGEGLSFHPMVVFLDPPILVWRSFLMIVIISSDLEPYGCFTSFSALILLLNFLVCYL